MFRNCNFRFWKNFLSHVVWRPLTSVLACYRDAVNPSCMEFCAGPNKHVWLRFGGHTMEYSLKLRTFRDTDGARMRKKVLERVCSEDLPSTELWPVNLQNFTWCKSKVYKVNYLVAHAGSCLSCQLAGDESLKFKCNKANMAGIKALPLCPRITWQKSHKSQSCNVQTLWLRPSLSNYITRLLPVIIVTGPRNDYMQVHLGLWPPSVGSSVILSLSEAL